MTIDSKGSPDGVDRDAIAYLRPPEPETLFASRAERFGGLAPGHALEEYLEFLARLGEAQRVAWKEIRPRAQRGLEAPFDARTHRRDPAWRAALRVLVAQLARGPLPSESQAALEWLARAPDAAVEAIADRVLADAPDASDLSTGPFVAAALQVYFTSLAAGIDAASVPRSTWGCPVCGSPPVAGVVLGDDRLRYLVCSLCASQWHHTRIQCTACRGAEHLAYFRLDGERVAAVPGAGAVKAEACGRCKAYTKLFYLDVDPRLEPFADDVATLALDLLMAEEGWSRHGVNPLLLPADAPPALA